MSRKRGANGRVPSSTGPAYPVPLSADVEQGPCTIIFGHNADIRKVLMQFSVSTVSLIFSPDDARDVAAKLNHFADMADGRKAH